MSMMTFRRKEPAAPTMPASLAHVSHETAQYFQRAAEVEAECEELRDTVARLKAEADERDSYLRTQIAERDRKIEFLERQIEIAEGKRDRYHLRAVAAETTLLNVSNTLIEQAERTRAHAAMDQQQADPPRGNTGARDLDEKPAGELLFLQDSDLQQRPQP
jgi:hypothetical protein